MNNSINSKKLPSVGVVIRTFNSDKYLIDSIESVINQNYSPMEIVVVDGGSTDQTIEIIVSDVKNNMEIEEHNKKLTIWTTVLGEGVNDHGLRSHSQIKIRESRPDPFQFHMKY